MILHLERSIAATVSGDTIKPRIWWHMSKLTIRGTAHSKQMLAAVASADAIPITSKEDMATQ
jgi:hypothetical protein